MTVIAKMNIVVDPRDFGPNQLVEMACVCDNNLMATHSAENENYTFNQASPSGDVRMTLSKTIEFRTQEELYLIFERSAEPIVFENALAVVNARCVSITDFGGTSKRVEVASVYRDYRQEKTDPRLVESFSLRMMIDNPKASVAFEPGRDGYWIGIYRASDMSMSQALAYATK